MTLTLVLYFAGLVLSLVLSARFNPYGDPGDSIVICLLWPIVLPILSVIGIYWVLSKFYEVVRDL